MCCQEKEYLGITLYIILCMTLLWSKLRESLGINE